MATASPWVPLRVLWGYSAANACLVASQPSVTVASEYLIVPSTVLSLTVATAVLCNNICDLRSRLEKSGCVDTMTFYVIIFYYHRYTGSQVHTPTHTTKAIPINLFTTQKWNWRIAIYRKTNQPCLNQTWIMFCTNGEHLLYSSLFWSCNLSLSLHWLNWICNYLSINEYLFFSKAKVKSLHMSNFETILQVKVWMALACLCKTNQYCAVSRQI